MNDFCYGCKRELPVVPGVFAEEISDRLAYVSHVHGIEVTIDIYGTGPSLFHQSIDFVTRVDATSWAKFVWETDELWTEIFEPEPTTPYVECPRCDRRTTEIMLDANGDVCCQDCQDW